MDRSRCSVPTTPAIAGTPGCPWTAITFEIKRDPSTARGYDWLQPGGYHRRSPEAYDRARCLLPTDVLDFILATQPKEWQRLSQHYGDQVKERFLTRLASEIQRRGALAVLRSGVKDMGCAFRLAYFRPASGLNADTRRLYAANFFAVARQVRYSTRNENSLDLVLFLNGLPIFTAELKNPLTGQTVEHAIRQYQAARDSREPLFAYGRCLAHFAVDPDLVYVTTHLAGAKTRFLPFNRGEYGGAGNPPVPPTQSGYATAYLWEETWARDSVLDLVRQFIHEVEDEDETGRKTGRRFLIFPRYQQLDCVRRLRHQRPARARPPAPEHRPPVRANPGRGGEHRHHLAPAQGSPQSGPDHHRHHAAEIPGDAGGDRRAAGPAVRADRRRSATPRGLRARTAEINVHRYEPANRSLFNRCSALGLGA